jgi:competence protein ComEC
MGLLALAIILLILTEFYYARRYRVLSILACALLGFCWAAWMAQQRLTDQLPDAWETKEIQLTGIVASLPQRFERGERFEFDVESVQTRDAIVPGHVQFAWYRSLDDLGEGDETVEPRSVRPGERWRFTVSLKRPHANANPHGFDYEAWLLERNIRANGTIRSRAEMQRLDRFVWRPGYAVERLREAIRNRFVATLPDALYLGVLIALTVGDQRSIPNTQWQVFNRTGVTHLVSIKDVGFGHLVRASQWSGG